MPNDVDNALARTNDLKAKIERIFSQYQPKTGAKPMNTQPTASKDDAIDAIDAPFTLGADAIVERTNKETGAIVYEVEKDGKIIYSTITRPLAFAFLAGVNAVPGAPKKASPAKEGGKSGGPESASVQQSLKDVSDKDATPNPKSRKRVFL